MAFVNCCSAPVTSVRGLTLPYHTGQFTLYYARLAIFLNHFAFMLSTHRSYFTPPICTGYFFPIMRFICLIGILVRSHYLSLCSYSLPPLYKDILRSFVWDGFNKCAPFVSVKVAF